MVAYGNPFEPEETFARWKTMMFGLYDIGLGITIFSIFKKVFPEISKYSSPEQIENYNKVMKNNSRLSAFTDYIIAPMFGFKDAEEYYRSARISGNLHKLKRCPTMFLHSWDDILVMK